MDNAHQLTPRHNLQRSKSVIEELTDIDNQYILDEIQDLIDDHNIQEFDDIMEHLLKSETANDEKDDKTIQAFRRRILYILKHEIPRQHVCASVAFIFFVCSSHY